MKARPLLKLGVRLASYAIVAACFWYLGTALIERFDELRNHEWDAAVWPALAAGALAYAGATLFLALSWSVMALGALPRMSVFYRVVEVYGKSAIGKYLPGNVLHFVGRQILGRSLGVSQIRLGLATLGEIGLSLLSVLVVCSFAFSFAAGSFAAGGLGSVEPDLSRWIFAFMLLAVVATLVAPKIGVALLQKLFPRVRGAVEGLDRVPMWLALGLNLAYFLCLGVIAVVVFELISPAGVAPLRVAAIYLAAWLVGFVVPGASGGIGVREAAILTLLGPEAGDTAALGFALLMRLQNVVADVLLFCLAALISRFSAETKAA